MKLYEAEVETNFAAFRASNKGAVQATSAALEAQQNKFLTSYKRIVSVQAWRSELLETKISPDSLAFFLEAQNDALTSHVLAGLGSWRSSLKALRSCLENVFFAMYYKDHPVELQLWEVGRHKPSFSDISTYFKGHPAFQKLAPQVKSLPTLTTEYSTLSKAVHASAKGFRMSVEDVGVQLWSADVVRLNAWATRESLLLGAPNLFLMTLFRDELQGGRLPNLRKAISLVITPTRHPAIKQHLGVTLLRPGR